MGDKIPVEVGDLRIIKSMAECGDTNEVIKIVNAILKENGESEEEE